MIRWAIAAGVVAGLALAAALALTSDSDDGPASPFDWELAPGTELTPATDSLEVIATERACTGGEAPGNRLREPVVRYTESSVILAISADALPDGFYTCPGNPPVSVVVELSEPLGDRSLVEG